MYRETARRRGQAAKERLEARRERALEVARRGAAVLRQEFGANPVILFGSAARGEGFHDRSDVDLAAGGLIGAGFFAAVARLQDLSSEFQVDLVPLEDAAPSLRAAIDREGLPL